MSGDAFRILSIDGGGIRGVFPAYILSCLSSKLKVNIKQSFQMISGTSTGAIIAAAIACDIDPLKIVNLYRQNGSQIFSPKPSYIPSKCIPIKHFRSKCKKTKHAFQTVYDNEPLKAILKEVFGDVMLGEVPIPLLLPATNVGLGTVHVFKSGYSRHFTRDPEVLVRDAVLASCSAPTYFDPTKVGHYLLADGGLWANNPSLAAVIDAQKRLGIPINRVKVLSLGTGHAKKAYGIDESKTWGLLRGWGGPDFIDFLMSLQAQSTHNYLQLMLGKEQLLRLNFESDMPIPLDNCDIIEDLVSRADQIFTYSSEDIMKFFELIEEGEHGLPK